MAFPRDQLWGLCYVIYIYINNMHKATTKCALINYADDTTLVSTVETFDTNGQEHQLKDNINKELTVRFINIVVQVILAKDIL